MKLKFAIHTTKQEVSAVEKEIAHLQSRQQPVIHQQPMKGWSVE